MGFLIVILTEFMTMFLSDFLVNITTDLLSEFQVELVVNKQPMPILTPESKTVLLKDLLIDFHNE